jgi:mono/diheme cytochrome c family protein
MKKLLLLFAIAGVVFACGSGGNGNEISAEALADGKATFGKFCVACHGATGNMALNGAKKFGESTLTLEERITVITNGRNLMTPYKGILTEDQIKNVAAYTIELTEASK